jgi:hypothetical protein
MTLTRKQTKRTTRRVTRKSKRPTLDTRQIVGRIDAMMRELEIMRRQLTELPKAAVATGLTQELFGAAGRGTRDEYDMNLDWKRFAEWQLR